MPTNISFDDTHIAFSGKTDAELSRAYFLFKAIGNNLLVKTGPFMVNLAMTLHLPIKGLIKATIFNHFCGGENILDCEQKIDALAQFNIGTILDYSVEGAETEMGFDFCMNEILATVKRAENDKKIAFCVFKTTGLARVSLLEKVSSGKALSPAEKEEFDHIGKRVDNICKASANAGVRIFIDAEESWIQPAIDQLAEKMMMRYNATDAIVYNTIQLYRTDRLAFLKHSFEHAKKHNYVLGVKLVRGAYMEKERGRALKMQYPSPIQPNKTAADRDFDSTLDFCTDHIDRIAFCAGTHNEVSSMILVEMMQQKNIAHNHPHVYFSQLLGMSDHISFNLADKGYNVAKYVPYGPVKSVLPYLFRRANENTSISGQMGRELSLIVKERKRRRQG